MGLLYQFPVKVDPLDDRISQTDELLVIKSYGLPYLFWGYFFAICIVIFFMFLAILDPIKRILKSDDAINHALAYSVLTILILGPIIALGFFFYEKTLIKEKSQITILQKIFGIPIRRQTFNYSNVDQLTIEHYLDSPNMAKIRGDQEFKGFENRGYYQLFINDGAKKSLLDRNNRVGDLKKIKELLQN